MCELGAGESIEQTLSAHPRLTAGAIRAAAVDESIAVLAHCVSWRFQVAVVSLAHMIPTHWTVALSFVALAPCQAQNLTSSDSSIPPPAAAADVRSIDAILHAKYDVLSGPAGPRDWNRFYSLFIPSGGRLIRTRRTAPDSTPYVTVTTPQEFAEQAGEFLSKNAFYEETISQTVDTFGAVTQVFSAYASRHAKDDPQPFARGIDSFQLFNDGKRWYIVTVWWDAERPGNPVPARYLPGSK